MLWSKGFRGGVHPPYSKLTAGKKIEKAKLPKVAVLPLCQHVGAPCEPLVKVGDQVKAGQKIADSKAVVSAPVHSSVSGKVVEISPRLAPTCVEVQSIIIESDGRDEWVETSGLDMKKASKEEILAKIRECGIAGMGGAAFPTHVKLNPPKDKKVEVLIVNGVECEPFITANHRLMLEEGEKILGGVRAAAKVLGVQKAIIAIEDNKPDAVENMKKLAGTEFEVVALKTKYPQGDERHLIKTILNREVPAGGLPFDIGAVVLNVETAKAINDALTKGLPLVERVVTVTGDVAEPKNLLVRIGTPFTQLIEECGGPVGNIKKLVCGGPMMGMAQPGDASVVKGSTCVLVLNEAKAKDEEEKPCIRCGRCVDACPMGLLPVNLSKLVERRKFEMCTEYNIMSCDECGCCSYVCPSKIPLVDRIRQGKAAVKKVKK